MTAANFSFLIFQPNPSRDLVWYYIDGSSSRNVTSRDSFLAYAELKCIDILPQLKEALQTYSFYLWDFIYKKVTLLHPVDEGAAYKDSIPSLVVRGLKGLPLPDKQEESDPLTAQLYKFGFQVANEEDVKNLRVTLSKQRNQTTLFGRMKNVFSSSNTKKK